MHTRECINERVRELGAPLRRGVVAPSSFHCAVLHCSSSVIHLRLCASGGLASPEQACRSHHTPNSGRCVVPCAATVAHVRTCHMRITHSVSPLPLSSTRPQWRRVIVVLAHTHTCAWPPCVTALHPHGLALFMRNVHPRQTPATRTLTL
jgi:hypothetical protein